MAWPFGEIVATLRPTKRPPILLISMPRAGSTWVGHILGSGEESLYLDEPLTRSYLHLVGNGASFFEYDACKDQAAYDRLASLAFRGVPRFLERSIFYPEQWSLFGRRRKRVIIKEVNPLVLHVWIARFRPRVVYLLRHPAAVARSVHALGWTGEQFLERFTRTSIARLEKEQFYMPRNATFWEQSGAIQALAQRLTLDTLTGYADYVVLRYEDLCRDPLTEFKRLFNSCELPFSTGVRERIEASARSDAAYEAGRYDTVRNSREMAGRWRHEVSPENVDLVHRGYSLNRPAFYTGDAEW
jgi:sulfotransferase family protein